MIIKMLNFIKHILIIWNIRKLKIKNKRKKT